MKNALLLVLLLCSLPSVGWAVISNATNWEVRTTGADTNGGGFVPGSSGTDRSQSDTPFCTATDLVTAGTSATSATCPFSATSVGNLIHITLGGCTAGFYQVVSVAVATATLDASAGTSTGCTFALGGALTTFTFTTIASALQNGNTVWVKSGTYALAAVANNALIYIGNLGSSSFFTAFIGYQTTHGDSGTKPLITTATTNFIVSISGGGQSSRIRFENLSMSSTAGSPTHGIISQGNASAVNVTIYNCLLSGFAVGIFGNQNTGGPGFPNLRVVQTEIKNCTSHAISNCDTAASSNGGSFVDSCYLHDNGGSGFDLGNRNGGHATITNTVMYKNANGITVGVFVTNTSALSVVNSDISDSTGDGININTSTADAIELELRNNIFYNNGGWGVNNANAAATSVQPNANINFNNAFGANASGTLNNMTANATITLTADPFVARTANNFALNSTAGGGTAAKAAGIPGVIPNAGTGFPDVGALQSQCTGGGGGGVSACAFVQ